VRKSTKIVLSLFVLCIGTLGIVFFLQKKPEAFTDKLVMLDIADPHWEIPVSKQKQVEIDTLLQMPYCYLGKGKQCVAFESSDQRYVIKLLLQKKLRLQDALHALPDFFPFSLYKAQKAKYRATRKKMLLESFKIAYEIIPEHTGIVFLHLNPTPKKYSKMCFIDSKQNPETLDVNALQFVVQKKARLIKPTICAYMWQGDIDKAKRVLDQAFDLLFQCAKKGVHDLDTGLVRNNNIGLLDDRAIYIDIGKLRYMPDIRKKHFFIKDLNRLKPLHTWLKKYYPELAEYYQLRQKEIAALYPEKI